MLDSLEKWLEKEKALKEGAFPKTVFPEAEKMRKKPFTPTSNLYILPDLLKKA